MAKTTNVLFSGHVSQIAHLKGCACIVAMTMNCTCGGVERWHRTVKPTSDGGSHGVLRSLS